MSFPAPSEVTPEKVFEALMRARASREYFNGDLSKMNAFAKAKTTDPLYYQAIEMAIKKTVKQVANDVLRPVTVTIKKQDGTVEKYENADGFAYYLGTLLPRDLRLLETLNGILPAGTSLQQCFERWVKSLNEPAPPSDAPAACAGATGTGDATEPTRASTLVASASAADLALTAAITLS